MQTVTGKGMRTQHTGWAEKTLHEKPLFFEHLILRLPTRYPVNDTQELVLFRFLRRLGGLASGCRVTGAEQAQQHPPRAESPSLFRGNILV